MASGSGQANCVNDSKLAQNTRTDQQLTRNSMPQPTRHSRDAVSSHYSLDGGKSVIQKNAVFSMLAFLEMETRARVWFWHHFKVRSAVDTMAMLPCKKHCILHACSIENACSYVILAPFQSTECSRHNGNAAMQKCCILYACSIGNTFLCMILSLFWSPEHSRHNGDAAMKKMPQFVCLLHHKHVLVRDFNMMLLLLQLQWFVWEGGWCRLTLSMKIYFFSALELSNGNYPGATLENEINQK